MDTVNALLHTAQHTYGLDRDAARAVALTVLGKPTSDKAWLISHGTEPLHLVVGSEAVAHLPHRFAALCSRVQSGEPLAYVLGCTEFYGLKLAVSPQVLIPRPDTETLVDWALERLRAMPGADPEAPRVLDLGTGSGAVACAVKAHCTAAHLTALDASEGALAVARRNAEQLELDVRFLHSDWFAALPAPPILGSKVAQKFDLILSNPPYIAEDDTHLPALRHEPLQALTSGADGLNDLRHIVDLAPAYLKPHGWLLLEHGYDQAEAVQQLMRSKGFSEVSTRQDLGGNARCTGGRMPQLKTIQQRV